MAIVLAGGRGERLRPLTTDRAKPAVPFGGAHRILDFTIASCVRSGVPRIHLLTQYQLASIVTHVRPAWRGLIRGQPGWTYVPRTSCERRRLSRQRGCGAAEPRPRRSHLLAIRLLRRVRTTALRRDIGTLDSYLPLAWM